MVELFHLETGGRRQLIFNLTSNVGTKSPNRADDVALVQLGFRALAPSGFAPAMEDHKVFAAVDWTGHCSGEESDPLVRAIRRFQAIAPNGVRDGHISTIKDADGIFRLGSSKGTYALVDLMSAVMEVHAGVWPRLDRIDGCPPPLRDRIAAILLPPPLS